MERVDQLRAGQRPGAAVHRGAQPRRALHAAARARPATGAQQARRRADRRRGRVRRHRQGLRGRRRPVRRGRPERTRRARPRGVAPDRHRGLRRPGRDRPDLLRPALLPDADERGGRQALQAARRGDGARRQGRGRPLRDAQQGVPRRRPCPRRPAAAVDDALRRRGRRPGRARRDRHARRGRGVATASSRWPSSSSTRWSTEFDPSRYHDEYQRTGHRVPRGQGRGAADRDRRARARHAAGSST